MICASDTVILINSSELLGTSGNDWLLWTTLGDGGVFDMIAVLEYRCGFELKELWWCLVRHFVLDRFNLCRNGCSTRCLSTRSWNYSEYL